MARVKKALNARKRHKKILKLAKGTLEQEASSSEQLRVL